MQDFRGASNRRRHERVPCKLEMHCTVLGPVPYEYGVAYAIDISESGACLFGRTPVKPPLVMQIDLRIPMPPYHHLLMAKVHRCTQCEETDLYEINIEFIGRIPVDMKKRIAETAWKDKQTY